MAARKVTTPAAQAHRDPERLSVMDIAVRFSVRYQRARDWMLSGRFGPAEYKRRTLTVTLAGVVQWEQRQQGKTQ